MDPNRFDVDPDPRFNFDSDLDRTFHVESVQLRIPPYFDSDSEPDLNLTDRVARVGAAQIFK